MKANHPNIDRRLRMESDLVIGGYTRVDQGFPWARFMIEDQVDFSNRIVVGFAGPQRVYEEVEGERRRMYRCGFASADTPFQCGLLPKN
jgi:hypothetical protein